MKNLPKNYLYKNSFIIAFWRFFIVFSGFILDAIVLAYFGLGKETDAFFVALALPSILVSIYENQIGKVIVPIIAQLEDNVARSKYLSNLLNINFSFLLLITILGVFLGPYLIPLQAPGLDPTTLQLSVNINYILFFIFLFSSLSSFFKSTLNAIHEFSLPASMKFFSNLVCILIILIFHSKIGIFSYCIGLVFGRLFESFIVLLITFRKGFIYRMIFDFKDAYFQETIKLTFYAISTNLLGELKIIFENLIASFLPSGVLSGYRYASRIIQSITSILVGSINVAMLPLAGSIMANNNLDEMKKQLNVGLRLISLLSLTASVFLITNSRYLIEIAYERGKFSNSDTFFITIMISLLTPYIFLSRFSTLMQMPFYAIKNMKTPFKIGVISFFIYLLILFFTYPILHIFSLPFAIFEGGVLSCIISLYCLEKEFGKMEFENQYSFFIKLLFSVIIFGLSMKLPFFFFVNFKSNDTIFKLFVLSFIIIIGIFILYYTTLKFKIDETVKIKTALYKKIKMISKILFKK